MAKKESSFIDTVISVGKFTDWPRQFAITLLYLLCGYAVYHFIPNSTTVSIVWPGSGLALGVLLIYGAKYILGVIIGALILSAISYDSLWAIGGITLANSLEAYLGYWLLNRQSHSFKSIGSLQDYLRVLCWGAVVASVASAFIGTTALLLSHNIEPVLYSNTLYNRWMGHAIGMVLITPLILAWLQNGNHKTHIDKIEALKNVLLVGLTLFIGQIVFLGWFHSSIGQIARGYWMFLFIVWVAIRLGLKGITFVLVITGTQALAGALNGIGFFSNDLANTGLQNYWYYTLILSVVGITLATYVHEIKQGLISLRIKDTALNTTANAIVITDVKGRIEWANNAFTHVTGYSLDEAYMQNPRDLVKSGKHDNAFYKALWDTILANKVWRNELVNRRKDGSFYYEDMTITPMSDEAGTITHFVAVKQDITDRKLAEQRITYSETLYHGMFENMTSAVAVYTVIDEGADFVFKDVNRSLEKMDKVLRNDLIGKRLVECFPGVKEFGLFEVLQRVWQTGKPEAFPTSFYRDGRISGWRDNHIYRLPSGEVVAIYDDVTEKKMAELTIKESHQKLHYLLNSMAEGVYGVDVKGNCTFVNHAFLKILGYTSETEVIGKHIHELIHHSHPDGSHYPADECRMCLAYKANQGIHCADEVFWCVDTQSVPVEYWSQPIEIDGIVIGAIATFMDITERLEAEKKIHDLAFYDPLTQLTNRRMLNDRITQALAQSKRSNCHMALLMLDLDNFKPLNDNYGHEVGDLLLIEVANRLKGSVREVDTVARFGGDEFVVLIGALDKEKVVSVAQATTIAEKIRVSLSASYLLTKHEDKADVIVDHQCTASIGVYVFNSIDYDEQGNILNRADAAMYQAKEAGRNLIQLYDSES